MIGQQIHHYKIIQKLGSGGMGIVYLAEDTLLNRKVAIKSLHPHLLADANLIKRFKNEAQLLARLNHPNITTLYSLLQDNEKFLMVMEYVEGKTFDVLIKESKFGSAQQILPLFIQVFEGLHHAHTRQILHRDIKPSNLMLMPDGSVKIMDFGIAKLQGSQALTQTRKLIGTLEYMSPELLKGENPSAAADIYAVGMVMYEILAQKLPFSATSDFELMQQITSKPIPRLAVRPDLPTQFTGFVHQMLQPIADNRPQTALACSQKLQLLKDLPQQKSSNQLPSLVLPQKVKAIFSQIPQRRHFDGFKQKWLLWGLTGICIVFVFLLVKDVLFAPKPQNVSPKPKITDNPNVVVNHDEPAKPLPAADVSGLATLPEKSETFKKPDINTKPKDDPSAQNPPKNKRTSPKNNLRNETSDSPLPKEDNKTKPPESLGESKKNEEPPPLNTEPKIVENRKESLPNSNNETANRLFVERSLPVVLRYSTVPVFNQIEDEQRISLLVANDVIYKGKIIIKKGAYAQGSVKRLDKKKMQLYVRNVEAVDGSKVSLKDFDLSGKIEDFQKSTSFQVKTQKDFYVKTN